MSLFKKLAKGSLGLALFASAGAAIAGPFGYALTSDQRLIQFSLDGTLLTENDRGALSGFVTDSALVGIDFRPLNGQLIGVGNAGGVYSIGLKTGNLTLINRLSVALNGTQFGVDFNPTVDRIRIVSNTGQNLRHNPNTGGTTLEDLALNYTAGVTASGIVSAAYTNNDANTDTGTTLFNLDATLDQVVIQSPPNNGSLAATGKFGLDVGTVAGFDIRSRVNGSGVTANAGFAVLDVGGVKSLYSVNLLDGSVTALADFTNPVIDLSLPIQ